MKSKFHPDKNGYFGQFGGAFIPELLYPNVKELEDNYIQIIESEEFQKEYKSLLKDYTLWHDPVNGLCIEKHILGESLQLIEECIDAFTAGLPE